MKLNFAFLILSIIFVISFALIFNAVGTPAKNIVMENISMPLPTPTPTPVVLKQAVPKEAYTILLLGDSMTEALGPNSDELRKALKTHYGDKVFGIFNLAKGSTSINSLQTVIENEVLGRQSEVIIIESFGNNPLSELPLEEGLKKQTELLDKAVETIRTKKTNDEVNSIIVFLATIAPNKDNYAKNSVDLTSEERVRWANERSAYIKNHMEYARKNNIPLINVYDRSLDKEGLTGDLQYIERGTFIHPSKKGLELISKEIADFLYNEKILPPE